MSSDLQKIVVLCVFIIAIVFIGYTLAQPPSDSTSTQIDPPSLDIETGPEDATREETGSEELPGPDMVACTMDAKQCPDGSYVGRIGPDCEFAACPSADTEADVTVCTDEMKQSQMCTREYAPVCGLVEVQCITTPCNPIPETFSNGCTACAQGNVASYTAGACEASQ